MGGDEGRKIGKRHECKGALLRLLEAMESQLPQDLNTPKVSPKEPESKASTHGLSSHCLSCLEELLFQSSRLEKAYTESQLLSEDSARGSQA